MSISFSCPNPDDTDEYALQFIAQCEGYKEYPMDSLVQYCAMVKANRLRATLHYRLRQAYMVKDVIQLQNQLNEIPIYLSAETTRQLYRCKEYLKRRRNTIKRRSI